VAGRAPEEGPDPGLGMAVRRGRRAGATPAPIVNDPKPAPATGDIHPSEGAQAPTIGALLPENAIVADEAVTTRARAFFFRADQIGGARMIGCRIWGGFDRASA